MRLAEGGDVIPVQIRTIAEKEGLSTDYVGKLLTRLRKSGLVKSGRGLNGGYILTRKPEAISLGQALMALSEKPIQMNHLKRDLCGQFPGKRKECVHLRGCSVRQVWSLIIMQVFGSLNRIPLSHLLGTESEVQNNLLEFLNYSQGEGGEINRIATEATGNPAAKITYKKEEVTV